MAKWNHQRWGRAQDLIHQSDLNSLVGKFGCLEQFRRKKAEHAASGPPKYDTANGKLISGNAVHGVLHRILSSEPATAAALNPEYDYPTSRITKAFDEEYDKERAGRSVDWYKTNEEKHRADCVAMLVGVLAHLHEHVAEVVAVEAGFVYHVDGIWLTGACDLIYRAEVGGPLCLGDWKTGAQKPHAIELDHGWQSGIYAGAMRHGYWVRFENIEAQGDERHRDALERECASIAAAWQLTIDHAADLVEAYDDEARHEIEADIRRADADLQSVLEATNAERFDEFPDRIRYVHLRDFIPYTRKGKRKVERADEMKWAGMTQPGQREYVAGDLRGPGWLTVQRSESDAPRLSHLLRAVVSWIRFGRFPAAPGEMCTRCRFREACLLEGYKPIGEEKKRLQQATKQLDMDGLGFEL